MKVFKIFLVMILGLVVFTSELSAQMSWNIRLEAKDKLQKFVPPSSPKLAKVQAGSTDIRVYGSSNVQAEVSIVTNPANPSKLLIGSNTQLGQGYYYSTNAGVNWTGSDALPGVTTSSSDPAVDYDGNGNAYFNYLENNGSVWQLFVKKSTDGGINWQSAVQIPNTSDPDKNHMVIDVTNSPYRNYIYTAYTDGSVIKFSRSTDGGTSFSPAVDISKSATGYKSQGVNLNIGPNGEVYAVWAIADDWALGTYGSDGIGFVKSTDGGATWQTPARIFDINGSRDFWYNKNPGGIMVRMNDFPCIAVDRSGGARNGTIYLVYGAKGQGSDRADILFCKSTDGGGSWSTPVRVNNDNTSNDQWFPWITVNTYGVISIVFYDSRNDPQNQLTEVWTAISTDGGQSFTNSKVSDVAFMPYPAYDKSPTGYMGDYLGITSTNEKAYPCWMDNRYNSAYQVYVDMIDLPLPKIASFSQNPDPLYNGGTGTVYAHLSQGTEPITYSWSETHYPAMTVVLTPNGSSCQVYYYLPYNTSHGIFITCTASNAYGSDTKTYQLHTALYGYSPASLAFAKNGTLTDENPVLVSSVDNPGIDVTDYYLINEKITPENQTDGKAGNVIKFSIHETDQAKGHTDLDQVELWEVKANPNEFIAVTEEGEVISYKKLATPDQIILNDSLDVTNILADKDNLKLTVKKGDRIKIKHTGNAEELYSVFYAQLYNAEELSAANDNSSDLYYFRPQSSAVCKKLKVVPSGVVPSGDIEIEFSKDLILDYLALVKNEKTAQIERLKLLSAEHSKAGEIASLFATADKQYGEILPGEEIKFKYETKLNSNNDNTAYILKTVGRYEKAGMQKEGNLETLSVLPKETTLYDNYPNPFNPTAKISFSIPQKSEIKLKVFDVLGREIQILAEGIYEAGKYEVEFNATNLPSGVYFYNLTTGTNSITKKMLLLR